MTIEEYISVIEKDENNDELKEKFRSDFLKKYRAEANGDSIKEYVAQLYENVNTTGQSVLYVETEELAEKILDEACNALTGILLDEYISPYEDDGEWVVDVMFGGYFVPEWE